MDLPDGRVMLPASRETSCVAPTQMQTLILWALVTRGGEAAQKDLLPVPDKKDREALVRLGLLQTRVGARRAQHLELTDHGWAWAADNMAAALPARSTAGIRVLADLLVRLGAFLTARDVALADFIRPAAAAPAPSPAPPDLSGQIRAAYLAATGGELNRQLRLAELRAALPAISRPELDAALQAIERAGGAGLLPLDDPTEIRPEDRAAALLVGGRPRHLLWLKR